MLRAGGGDLLDRVHREAAGAFEPELVPGALEQLQERIPVAGGAVAELGALFDRAGAPREFAAPDEQLRQPLVARRQSRERGDHPGRAVAPLRADRLRRAGRLERRGPLAKPILVLSVLLERCDRPPLDLIAAPSVEETASGERDHVARKAMGRTEA